MTQPDSGWYFPATALDSDGMWPFRKRKRSITEKVILGLIIGGAIGSIIGKKMMEKHEQETDDGNEKKDAQM